MYVLFVSSLRSPLGSEEELGMGDMVDAESFSFMEKTMQVAASWGLRNSWRPLNAADLRNTCVGHTYSDLGGFLDMDK